MPVKTVLLLPFFLKDPVYCVQYFGLLGAAVVLYCQRGGGCIKFPSVDKRVCKEKQKWSFCVYSPCNTSRTAEEDQRKLKC